MNIREFEKLTEILTKKGIDIPAYFKFLQHSQQNTLLQFTTQREEPNNANLFEVAHVSTFSNNQDQTIIEQNEFCSEFSPESTTHSVLKQTSIKRYGKYLVQEEIARGGMGIVYRVFHEGLKQQFALKVLIAGEDASEETLKRFHREIETTAKLKHPNIIQILDSGQEGSQHYFVMEFIEGKTLSHVLEEKKFKLSARRSAELIKKCLDALHYAHKQKIIHRDLKPDNIMITKEGEPKLTDFGLAKNQALDRKSQKITHTGTIMGTPAYMSPEQANGEIREIDAISDIYSIGICFYELLTGKRPFHAQNIHTLLYQIVHEDPDPPSRWKAEIHRDLETIILKAIEKDRSKRYLNAKEFALDIERFLEGYPILARPANIREKTFKWFKRNRILVFFLLSFVLVLILGILFFQWKQDQKQQQDLEKIYQKAKEENKKANSITPKNKKDQEAYFEHLFNALNTINLAISLNPNTHFEQMKFEIGEKLITLACQVNEYRLATYLSKELHSLNTLPDQKKKEISEKVELERSKIINATSKTIGKLDP